MTALARTLEPEVMDTAEEARSYDAMDNHAANAAFVERLVELGAGGRMLDVGTGPGHIPLLVCECLPQATVVGVDLAEHMLAFARRYRAVSPHRARLEFLRADAKHLDFPDASFDTVFSNTILHHIPEPRTLLREVRRVLRPGGCLLIRDLVRPPSAERALELVALHAGDQTAEQQELLRASLHAALTGQELRELADEEGLEEAELTLDSDRHMSLQIAAS